MHFAGEMNEKQVVIGPYGAQARKFADTTYRAIGVGVLQYRWCYSREMGEDCTSRGIVEDVPEVRMAGHHDTLFSTRHLLNYCKTHVSVGILNHGWCSQR